MSRIEKVVNTLPKGFGACMVSSSVNRFYLLGVQSSAGTMLIFPEKAYLIIDFRYIEMATEKAKDIEVILQDKLHDQILELLKKHKVNTMLIEDVLPVKDLNELQKKLPDIKIDSSSALTQAIEGARAIKDIGEITNIKEAQRITDEGFTYICGQIAAGKRERDLALELDFFMRKQGAEGLAFNTIFVSGANSSLPHGVPGMKEIQAGDFITIDFGARYAGYNTDMTRTVAVGFATDKMKEVYETVLQAQLKTIDAVHAGVSCHAIDAVARDYIYEAGYEGKFGHGLGHSLGIEIHEKPSCGPATPKEVLLQAGMMMTIEPGIYLPGEFGVRIEDSVIVTDAGCENIAKSPKNLIIL